MMLMNILTNGRRCLLAALLFCVPALAQQSVKELASKIDHHYNALRSLKAGFTESYDGMGVHKTESGTMYLAKPGKMRWDYSSPAGKVFVLDGKYAWFYAQGDPHVQRILAKKLDDLRSPLRFLLGHTQLQKEFEHLTVVPAANGQFTLSGVPKGQENRIDSVRITATPQGTITEIEINETDGAVTRFTFTNEEPNARIPSGAFHFTPPPGVPVVESLGPV